MGLDGAEIIMAVEEAFDISLEDSAVAELRTPGDLIDYVMTGVGQAKPAGCLTQRAFNLLRAALLRHLPLKRRDIAPSVTMADLVPKPRRKELLYQLTTELQTDTLLKLIRPRWLVNLLTGFSIVTGIVAGVALLKLAPGTNVLEALFGGAFAVALTGLVGMAATGGFRTDFPPVAATVGDFSRWIMAHKRDLASATSGHWTREQVAARVREIVIEQLDCAHVYREDASFVEDLGMG